MCHKNSSSHTALHPHSHNPSTNQSTYLITSTTTKKTTVTVTVKATARTIVKPYQLATIIMIIIIITSSVMVHVLLWWPYDSAKVYTHIDTGKLLRRPRMAWVETNIGRNTNKREKIRHKHLDYITLLFWVCMIITAATW